MRFKTYCQPAVLLRVSKETCAFVIEEDGKLPTEILSDAVNING
jgi:hypothetical protein